jgi:subfamily B ATP-binding cassette protein MsbA
MGNPSNSKQLYLRLLSYVKPYSGRFILGLVAMAVLALTQAGIPALIKPLIDGTFVEKDPFYITWMPIMLIGLGLLRAFSTFASGTIMSWLSFRVIADIRIAMTQKLLVSPIPFFDQHPTGTLISKVTYDVEQVAGAATEAIIILVKDVLTIIGLLAWMLFISWKLSVTAFIMLPFIALIVRYTGNRMRGLSRTLQNSVGNLTHALEENIKGQKVIKIYQGEKQEAQRAGGIINKVRQFQTKIRIASTGNVVAAELIGIVAFAVIIYVGITEAQADRLTAGGFMSFFAAMAMLFSPIKRLTSLNEQLQKALAASESIFTLIDNEPEKDQGSKTLQEPLRNIAFKDVALTYPGTNTPALQNINLDIKKGETLALVGPSGSGKSTLAAMLPRFYESTQGDITFNGININELRLTALRQQIAYVSQDIVLFNDTIAANLAYGMQPPPSEATIRQAADAAHITTFADKLPDGLMTQIGEDGVRLSGGQRQRIAIGRAFLKNAALLILDEATSALDNESEKHVQAALETLESGRTTLIIAHRLSTVENADRIIVLNEGQIAEQGTHTELLAQNGIYKQLYQTQFSTETTA